MDLQIPLVFISDIIATSKSKECSDIISVSKNEEHSGDVADTDIGFEMEKEDKNEEMIGKREEDGKKEKKIKDKDDEEKDNIVKEIGEGKENENEEEKEKEKEKLLVNMVDTEKFDPSVTLNQTSRGTEIQILKQEQKQKQQQKQEQESRQDLGPIHEEGQ